MTGLVGMTRHVPAVIDGPTWATPLTGLRARLGDARIQPRTLAPGYYRMEGIGGVEVYEVVGGPLPVASLQRRGPNSTRTRLVWREWMVDDPLHWYAMRERVMDLPPGRLLVAGLGLGLFAHHLVDRPDITSIDVVEIDRDVVDLIRPTLPDDPRVTIHVADYYQFIEGIDPPDAILWDLAVGDPEQTRLEFWRALIMTRRALGPVPLSCFGLRDGAWTIIDKGGTP